MKKRQICAENHPTNAGLKYIVMVKQMHAMRGLKLKSDTARAEKLSPEERLALARKAVQARWNRPLRQNRRTYST
jgi:hypothetical protein